MQGIRGGRLEIGDSWGSFPSGLCSMVHNTLIGSQETRLWPRFPLCLVVGILSLGLCFLSCYMRCLGQISPQLHFLVIFYRETN